MSQRKLDDQLDTLGPVALSASVFFFQGWKGMALAEEYLDVE